MVNKQTTNKRIYLLCFFVGDNFLKRAVRDEIKYRSNVAKQMQANEVKSNICKIK